MASSRSPENSVVLNAGLLWPISSNLLRLVDSNNLWVDSGGVLAGHSVATNSPDKMFYPSTSSQVKMDFFQSCRSSNIRRLLFVHDVRCGPALGLCTKLATNESTIQRKIQKFRNMDTRITVNNCVQIRCHFCHVCSLWVCCHWPA